MGETTEVMSAADLRAMVARSRKPRYLVAAEAGMHPTTLGLLLNERRPLSADVAERIVRAVMS
jgi:hypothetical protein